MIHFVVANENTFYELHVPALGQFYRSLFNGYMAQDHKLAMKLP